MATGLAIKEVGGRAPLTREGGMEHGGQYGVFQCFGFKSGRDADKFVGVEMTRAENGLAVLSNDCNAFFSLEVESTVDLGTHSMFICRVTEAQSVSKAPTMTYAYYHANVKPKPAPVQKKGWVCKICGYVYEGDALPADFVCPICKHPASDFEKL